MRYAIVMLFCIHALIHLIGVVKQWEWAELPASGEASVKLPTAAANTMGALWLAACVSLLAAAALLMQGEPLDASSARATMSHGGPSESADYFFDAQGRVERMAVRRSLAQGDSPPTLERWVVRMSSWGALEGTLIPTAGEVSWELKAGDFTYYRWQLTELQQNVSALYETAP